MDGSGLLTDKYFFPLALALIVGVVWLAVQRSDTACPTGSVGGADTNYTVINVRGAQLNRFIPTDDLTKNNCSADAPYILNLTATASSFPAAPDAGPHFRLGPDIQVQSSARKLRLIVRARAAPSQGAAGFEVNYHTGPTGASGWRYFPLNTSFTDHVLEYQLPKANEGPGVDYLAIRPVVAEEAKTLQIESVTIMNLDLIKAAEHAQSQ